MMLVKRLGGGPRGKVEEWTGTEKLDDPGGNSNEGPEENIPGDEEHWW